MKLNLSKKWYEQRIALEGDLEVGAGMPWEKLGIQGKPQSTEEQTQEELVERLAFGSLVQMLRRKKGLSIEQLADAANIDAMEIISIENEPKYLPRPRTVHQLSETFRLPERSLTRLSNLTTVHDTKLRDAAVRFAAHSSPVTELTGEESCALNEFVAYLSSQNID